MDISYYIVSRKKLLVLNFKRILQAGTGISRRRRPATPGATARTARVSGGNGTKFLVRPRKGRIVAGICTGIAGYPGEGEKTSVARGILGKKLNA
jgi:hypothetical protein